MPCCGHSAYLASCRGCQLFIEDTISPWSLASRPRVTSQPTPASPASALVPLVLLLVLPRGSLAAGPVLPTRFLPMEIPSFQYLLKVGFS